MKPILYESNETAFVSNGIGRLYDITECTVTEERNGIYECDFMIPVNGAHFNDIKCGRIIAVRHDDSDDIQPFDIVSYSKPINGLVTFHAVHVSYRQSKLTIYGTNINGVDAAFARLGASVPQNPFTYSAGFTSNAYCAAFDGIPKTVKQMLGGVEGSILDTYGGEYEWNRLNVILHRNRGVKRDFAIRYGVNMLDYQDDTDYSGTFSSCIPFWKNDTDIVRGSRVDAPFATYNGRVDCIPLDLTDKFETKPTAAQLETLALSYMQSHNTNMPQQTIKVDFVRLQDMGFENLGGLLECNLCDTVNVIFPEYGMSGEFKIVKTVYDVLEERYISMELGTLSTTLADALGITQMGGGLSDAPVIYDDFTFYVTFSAGTVGTRGAQYSLDVSKTGYTPISATVLQLNSGVIHPLAMFTNDLLFLNAYRATTGSVNNSALVVRVGYKKN